MIKFFETLAEYIFSGGMLIFLSIIMAFIAMIYVISESENQRHQATEFCYNQGNVLVTTDAGQRCVDPRALVKVPG